MPSTSQKYPRGVVLQQITGFDHGRQGCRRVEGPEPAAKGHMSQWAKRSPRYLGLAGEMTQSPGLLRPAVTPATGIQREKHFPAGTREVQPGAGREKEFGQDRHESVGVGADAGATDAV